jgi:hypothetical protein
MTRIQNVARLVGLAILGVCFAGESPARAQNVGCCPCDVDGSDDITSTDYYSFLGAFFAGDRSADMNADGRIGDADLMAFQECWASGCPCLDEPMLRGPAIITTSSCSVYFGSSPLACGIPASPCLCQQIIISFNEVKWSVCVMNKGAKGLAIGRVFMKSSFSNGTRQILKELSLAELFVPYHDNSAHPQDPLFPPFRPYDTPFCPSGAGCMAALTANDLPSAGGTLLTLAGDTAPRAIVECRDYGIAWLCTQATSAIRRGREVVIWGVLDGGNYDNIIEYHFRDDGRILVRMGNTGYVNPGEPFVAHMHDALWRIDMDLGGRFNDVPQRTVHTEPSHPTLPLHANDDHFWGYQEEAYTVQENEFTSLLIEDLFITNSHGNPIGYELQPWDRKGASRHFGPDDNWTHFDFWVTGNGPGEDGTPYATACAPINTWAAPGCHRVPDVYLNAYLNAETFPVPVPDTVVWYHSSAHHDVTDEDRAAGDPANDVRGVTLIHWHGFDLVPHNFFNANPLGAPQRCGN